MDSDSSSEMVGEQSTDNSTSLILAPPSEEPSMSKWSSMVVKLPDENYKRFLATKGLYDPGSGNVCPHYIAFSDSFVLQHPYYNYPSAKDPGIAQALNDFDDPSEYDDGGVTLYLKTCKQLNVAPIRTFYENLNSSTIDLKYYNFHPLNMTAMTAALENNFSVTNYNVSDSWLDRDACYHLGMMLHHNTTLTHLNLYGCRIGPVGMEQLGNGLAKNRTVQAVNIGRNKLSEDGGIALGKYIGAFTISKLNLSNNLLETKGANAISSTLYEYDVPITELDLSWNGPFSERSIAILIARFASMGTIEEIDLSWTGIGGPKVAKALDAIISSENLRVLNLSHNSIQTDDVIFFSSALKSSNLLHLDLSDNPITPEGPLTLVKLLTNRAVKLQVLKMDNVTVDKAFIANLQKAKSMKMRRDTIVTYGYVERGYEMPKLPDFREILLKRLDFVMKSAKSKKKRIDMATMFLQFIYYHPKPLNAKSFSGELEAMGVVIEDELLNGLIEAFPGPIMQKLNTLSPQLLKEFINRMYPEAHWEPEPEPKPKPEPEPEALPPPDQPEEKKTKR